MKNKDNSQFTYVNEHICMHRIRFVRAHTHITQFWSYLGFTSSPPPRNSIFKK